MAFPSFNMSPVPLDRLDTVAFLNPALCAKHGAQANGKESPCRNAANLVCVCRLVQVRCSFFSEHTLLWLVLLKKCLSGV